MSVPQSVTTALEGMATDALLVGALVFVAIIAVFAAKFLAKAISGQAMASSFVDGINAKGNHGRSESNPFGNYS